MTWFAHEVIAQATPEVLLTVRSNRQVSLFSYHIAHLLEHEWHTPEVVHGLPEGGLVVIRPVCDITPDESPADWYNEPLLDWCTFPERVSPTLEIDRGRVAEDCGLNIDCLPPPAFLAQLKEFAARTQSTFLFYSCFMWGGDIEIEYAWVFGATENVLVSLPSDSPGEYRPLAKLNRSNSVRSETGDVLVCALKHLSLELPTPYFAPHTRSFPWAKYKLVDNTDNAL